MGSSLNLFSFHVPNDFPWAVSHTLPAGKVLFFLWKKGLVDRDYYYSCICILYHHVQKWLYMKYGQKNVKCPTKVLIDIWFKHDE